jgi:nucleotide-binding universal stress UspA family protein
MTEHRDNGPLTPAQHDAIIEAGRDMGFRHRLMAETVPYTGLTFTEFCHLREDWLRYTDRDGNRITITVPLASPCAGTLRTEPSGREFEVLDEPCWLCQDEGEWTPPGDCRHRTIPVPEAGREALDLCFERYGMDSLPFTVSSNVYQWLDNLASRAGLSRSLGFKSLRRTYGTILIRKGFTSEEVADYLGLHRRTKTRQLYEAIGEPVDWETLPARGVSDEELIERLRRLAARLGRRPKMKDIDERFEYSYKPLYTRFGGLHAALEEANIEIPDRDPGATPRNDLLLALRQLASELGRPPTSEEMMEQGTYSCSPYWREFDSWAEALGAAGLNPEAAGTKGENKIEEDELLGDLRRLADELGRPPTQETVRQEGKYSPATYKRRLDGVKNAREIAGIEEPAS